MEVSGPLLQAAAPATVSLEQQLYTEEVAQIRASDLLDPQKQQGIKRLTYEFIRRLRHRPLQSPSAQSFFSQLDIRIRITAFSALSYVNMLLFPSRNGVSIERHLIAIRAILTPRAQDYLFTLIGKFPRRDEIEACFNNMGINIYSEGLEGINKAIQDRITPSKQDIEITAMLIGMQLASHDIDHKFPVFSEDNYQQELRDGISNIEKTNRDKIKKLDFSSLPIKVVPNILGKFIKLEKLNFFNCTSLTFPPDVRNNPALEDLRFNNCTSLQMPPDLSSNHALTGLSFSGCTNLIDPPDLSSNHDLTGLSFSCCTNLIDPPDLSGNEELALLDFESCTSLTTPPDLSSNPALTELSFSRCTSLETPPDLSGNQALTYLYFNDCTSLETLPDLSALTQLSTLDVRGVFPENPELNIDPFENLEEAQALIRAIEEYRKKPKRNLEAVDSTEAPRKKRGRPADSDSDDFDADAEKVLRNRTGGKSS